MRVRRATTSANSAATKKPFARTSRRMISKRPVTPPAPRCDVKCCSAAESVMNNQSIRYARDLTETQLLAKGGGHSQAAFVLLVSWLSATQRCFDSRDDAA